MVDDNREVRNTVRGRGAAMGEIPISSGDVVKAGAGNLDGTDDLSVRQLEMAAALTV